MNRNESGVRLEFCGSDGQAQAATGKVHTHFPAIHFKRKIRG